MLRSKEDAETRLYFVRHAHSNYEHGREMERGLSTAGTQQAERIRRILAQEKIRVFVSSPYQRAIDTLAPLAEECEQSIITYPDLRERLVSGTQHLGIEGFLQEKRKCYEDFDYKPAEGESSRAARSRALTVIENLLECYPGERIAIGTHGDILTLMLSYYDPKYNFEFWENLSMPDIYCVSFQKKKWIGIKRILID